jgi:hypothetical protein
MQFAVAFSQSGSSSAESKLEFRSVDFCGGRKNRRSQRKILEAGERTKKMKIHENRHGMKIHGNYRWSHIGINNYCDPF